MISKIAKYPVEAELGRGGFGVVYRAYDPSVGRPVAIKVLTAESDSELLKRFQDEVGTTGNLTHKNIVIVYESGSESGVPYLVMELLSGRTLQDFIKKAERMPLLDTVRIMTQVAEGLKYAHGKNVIHRDVKPGNVMLLNDGNVKIMDFGIARVTTRSTVVTREGYIIGTIPYMAPEQFQGGKADKQTDIFAYGVVYYQLLTGKHPFERDDNIYGTIERIKMVEPDPIGSLTTECPEALELLIYRAIAKDRDVRYASFDELLLDSEAILSDLAQDRAALILQEVPSLIEAGEIDAAEDKLKEVAELEPGNREARQLRKTIQDEKERRKVAARLPALLEESEAHLRERRFSEAVRTLETALRLTRNDESVQARLSEAQNKLEAHRQANKLLSEARRDQQRGLLPDALQRLKTALELDAEHSEARALFTRLEIEIQRREQESQLQEVITAASEHLSNKRYAQALAVLEEFGQHTRVADLRARIERQRDEDAGRKRIDQFNLAVSDIREALQAHELSRAGDLLDRLAIDFADTPDTAQVADDLRAQFDAQARADAIAAFSQQARDLIRQKWFPEALNLLEEATERFPEDAGLRRLQESAAALFAVQQRSEAMAAALKEANAFRDAGDLRQALDSIANARRRIGEDWAFDDLERQLRMELQQHSYAAGLEDLLGRVRALMGAADYTEAIRAMKAAQEYEGESEVRAALASAKTALSMQEEQRLVDSTIQAAEGFEHEGMLDRAAGLVQDARRKYPHNRALSHAADRIGENLSKQQRQAGIARHRAYIEQVIQEADWKEAQTAIRRAQREYPEEPLFETLADRVRRALFDAELNEAASSVREKLAANAISEAVEQLNVTRTIYSGDPRWKQREQEVAQREAYESALGHADLERERGDFGKAEELLTSLMQQGSFDDRLTRMLAEVQDRRISQEMAEADLAVGRGDFDRGLTLMETARRRATPGWASRIDEAFQQAFRKKEQELAIARVTEQANNLAARGEFTAALEAVAKGLKQFPDAEVLRRLQESLRVQARAASLALAGRLHQEGKPEAALQAVQAALRSAPDDRELLALKAHIETSIDDERREQELQAAGHRAEELLAQGKPEDAIGLIESLDAGERRFQQLLARARSEVDARHLGQFLARARELGNQGRYEDALKLLEQAAGRYGQASALVELQHALRTEFDEQRAREAHKRARARLLALEQQIDTPSRKQKLEELDAEAQSIGSMASADREIASIAARIHLRIESALQARAALLAMASSLQAEGDLDAALQAAQTALRNAPDDREVLEVKAQIEAAIEQERRQRQREQELEQAAKKAAALLAQGKQEEVIALIEGRYTGEPFETLLVRARAELKAKQLDQLLSRARALGGEARFEDALQLVEEGAARYGQTDALIELRRSLQNQLDEKRRQEARERDRAELVAIEKQVKSGPRKKKLNQLSAETLRIGAAYAADPEIAPIVARINQRIESSLTESAGTTRIPWKLIAAGGGAGAVITVALLVVVHRSPTPVPKMFPIEVRSDPPGASVSLGDRSCVTPNCRFDLTPGSYQVRAELKGYQPTQQTVTIESSGGPARVDLTMQPVPPPPPPAGTKTGTLVVQAGMPDAQVFVDDVARGRTDSNGALSLPLEAAPHDVRVEKNGFQTPKQQRITIADGRSRPVAFKLIPQIAKLELRGAPAGVEIRAGSMVLGRTDGSVFAAQVQPGKQTLQVIQGTANRQVAQNFEPGQTLALDWKDIAPSVQPIQPTQPTPAMIEAGVWDQARTSSDPAQVQAYLDKYPSGAHAAEALSRQDELMWSRNDPQAYLNRFPRGAHAVEAAQRIGDAVWSRVDQNNPQALRDFVAQNPNNAHRTQAQTVLDQIEKQRQSAEEALKQERAKREEAQKQRDAQAQQAKADDVATRQKVLVALSRFNTAFEHKKPSELKAVWPSADKDFLASVTVPLSALKLEVAGTAQIVGDRATILCNVVTQKTGQSTQTLATVTLQKRGSDWIILSLEANR